MSYLLKLSLCRGMVIIMNRINSEYTFTDYSLGALSRNMASYLILPATEELGSIIVPII